MKNQFKQMCVETAVMLIILFGVIMVAGPTAGEHSIAYKVSMSIYMGAVVK